MDQLPDYLYLIGVAGGPVILAVVLAYAMRRRKRQRPPDVPRH